MKVNELKKNDKVWCWWMSRYLYYTGVKRNNTNTYVFKDITDVTVIIAEDQIEELERR